MGFPNVDKYLVDIFYNGFVGVQASPTAVLSDLFEDLTDADRAEIATYLAETVFTTDTRQREDGQRYIYILPHFPLGSLPFPQIGVSLGNEAQAEKFIGDYTGEATAVKTGDVQTAWNIEKGYFAQAAYNVDVVCPTKDEAIWLSRFCQYFICLALQDLAAKGVLEVAIALKDLRLDEASTMSPSEPFNRGLQVTAKVANTWLKQVPLQTYQAGENTAL